MVAPFELDDGPSRIGRLFTYSKTSGHTALENFTTEALALAIRDQGEPMLRALRALVATSRGVPALVSSLEHAPGLNSSVTLRPSTQVYVSGGFLDLVLEVRSDGAVLGEIWIEVKTGALETGKQLDGYRADAARWHRRAWVITLGATPLRDDVPHLTWNALYHQASTTPNEHPTWRDLRRFLEEEMIASDALGTVTDREAGSLESAYALFQKASAVVAAVHKYLGGKLTDAALKPILWRSELELLNSAAAAFRKTGEFAGYGGALAYGMASHDGVAYWFVAVNVDVSAKVDAVMKKAQELPEPTWSRSGNGPRVLEARVRATATGDHDAVVAWCIARIDELLASGALGATVGI